MISDWELFFLIIFLFTTALNSWKELSLTDRTLPSWWLKEDSWCFFQFSRNLFWHYNFRWWVTENFVRFEILVNVHFRRCSSYMTWTVVFYHILCSSSTSLYKMTLDYDRDLSDLIFLDVVIHSSVMISSHVVVILDTVEDVEKS